MGIIGASIALKNRFAYYVARSTITNPTATICVKVMKTDRLCNTRKRCFRFVSVAVLIAGIKICRVGMVDRPTSTKMPAL